MNLPFFSRKRTFDDLIKNVGLNPSYKDKEGNNLLHLALMHNRSDIYSECIEKAGNEHEKNESGITPVLMKQYLFQKEEFFHPVYFECKGTLNFLSKEEFEQRFKIKYLNHLIFQNYPVFSDCFNKTKKKMELKNNRQMNRWAKAMFEKEFIRGFTPDLMIKHINSIIGYGVFAKEDIAQYTYVGEYTGVVRKKKNSTDQLNDYIFGYNACSSSTKYVVDAKEYGNITRLINHSDSPNLNSRWMEQDGVCHIILYTNQYVPKGNQLTYDYGPYYWRKRAHPLIND